MRPGGARLARRALPLLLLAAAARADARAEELDRMFALLKQAPSEEVARVVEARIRALWAGAASPVVGLLMQRGARDAEAQDWPAALADYDAALDLEPDFAEAWSRRASVRFMMGDLAGAARDLREVLRREPRQFDALALLSRLADERGDHAAALHAWEAVLALSPRTPGGEERLRELRRKALGEAM